MDFLRDPIWQFVGVIFALIAIIITLRARKRKIIYYEIISNTPVVSIQDNVKDEVQILVNGKVVENAHLLILRMWNSGNVPISGTDFIDPLTFNFEPNAKVISAGILEKRPDNIKVSINTDVNKVILELPLLNSKDSIWLKVLLNSVAQEINVKTRIIGMEQILLFDDLPQKKISRTMGKLKNKSRSFFGWAAAIFFYLGIIISLITWFLEYIGLTNSTIYHLLYFSTNQCLMPLAFLSFLIWSILNIRFP